MMGCWNHTCMLTNLPVTAGEKIATVILMKTREGYGDCHAYKTWHPAPVMYYGEYDDYGGSEDCYGSQIDYILKEFRDNAAVVKPDDEKKRGGDEYLTDIEQFSRDGDAGGLTLIGNDSQNSAVDVELAVIKTSVLDKFLDRYYWTDYKLKTANGDEVKITYKYLCGTIPVYIAKLKEHYAQEFHFREYPEVEWDSKDVLGRYVQHHASDVTPQFFRHSWLDRMKELTVAGDDDALTDFLEEFIKYMMIQSYYSYSRRVYVRPMCSSQAIETDAQELTAEITLEVAAQQRKDWEEEDYAEDQWDPVRNLFIEQETFTF